MTDENPMIQNLMIDREDGRPIPGPAIVVGEPMSDRELLITERMHRQAARDYPGSGVILFTETDEDGVEQFDNSVGQSITEAAKWRAIMKWPRDPTIAEVMAFQANVDAMAKAALWYALSEPVPK
jgi:hypothetical protein